MKKILFSHKYFGFSLSACLVLSLLTACLPAVGSNFLGLGTSWREEVVLHDGRTIMVKRTVSYRGKHYFGDPVPIGEQTISFKLPDSGKSVSWTSEYGEDIGRSYFNLLAVHILKDTPYLVTQPNGCHAYNKFGRPNPPYVFFRFDGTAWQRIPPAEFPEEFKSFNVNISLNNNRVAEMSTTGIVSADSIRKDNQELRQPEYKTILREPIKPCDKRDINCLASQVNCQELIQYKCGWGAPGEFNRRHHCCLTKVKRVKVV